MHSYISHNLKNTLKDKFLLPLGQTDEGCLQVADFFELEHILIGGDKDKLESYLKFIIQNLSSKYSSEELQFIINTHDKSIFCEFENLPHLYRGKINSTMPEILSNAQNLYRIYRDRHDLLAASNMDFFKYNESCISEKLPLIVAITHDYSLLKTLEEHHLICNLASKAFYAKNTGVFLIISTSNYFATSSFSKEFFEAYFSTRIAFFKKVTPKSSVLINSNADKLLLGNQLIFQHIDKSKQQTIQKLRILNYEK